MRGLPPWRELAPRALEAFGDWQRRLAAIVLLGAAGCGGAAAPVSAPPPTVPPPPVVGEVTGDPLATRPLGIFRSKRFDLALALPDGKGFAIDDTRGAWLSARHEASRSTLLVRRWREAALTNRAGCEASARRGRTLPTTDGAELLEVRNVAIPAGYDTEATVAVFQPPGRDGSTPPLFGMVMAFGSNAHGCFGFAFVTEDASASKDAVVAARLARIVDQTLMGLQARSDLDPRLERDLAPSAAPAPR